MLRRFFASVMYRRRARRIAEDACRALRPGAAMHGSYVCADEPDRWVVRAFSGDHPDVATVKRPPWREGLVFAVDKSTWTCARIEDDARYQPVFR